MDNTPKHESLFEWLQRRGLPGLPVEPRRETSPRGEEILHHPKGCHHENHTSLATQRAGPSGTPRVCGCLFKNSLQETTEKGFLAEMGALAHIESVFQLATRQDPYNLGDTFPHLRNLVIRHHRHYATKSFLSHGIFDERGRITACPALKQVGDAIIGEWDTALTVNLCDQAALSDEITRYAARYLLSGFVLRKTVGLQLALMNAMQDLVWCWLTKPITGTLVQEYYSAAGDRIRSVTVHPVAGSGFTMKLLEEIASEAEAMLSRNTLTACHLGGPDTNVFETGDGLRAVIIWNGMRVRKGPAGLGEYPQIVCEWFAQQDDLRQRSRVAPTATGGIVVPICESPGLDTQQWETAITLWHESFDTGGDDPGPYRDHKTAIFAAANL